MLQQTIEKLHTLRLAAMADGLQSQMTQPEIAAMPFEERLAVLVDLQHSAMLNAALAQRLKRAGMRQTASIARCVAAGFTVTSDHRFSPPARVGSRGSTRKRARRDPCICT